MDYEINLIEGERGKLHVTSDDARTKNALMFGTGRKVFNMDHAFEATMPDSNTVRITSGVFYDNGMFIRIDRDRYVEVPIDNGLPGTYRNDLVCIRYERNIQTQLESAGIVVKKGEASETKAVDPAYSVGDVLDLEVHLDEFPLYRVAWDGITPKLEPMFAVEDVMSNIVIYEELKEHLADDTPGYKHIPSGGSDGQILKWSSDGTAKWSDNILIDSEINNTSTNPVQNKVVKAEFDKVKSDLNGKANSSHTHTKSEVGLGNVDNTADANKNVKYATSAGSAPANGGNSATVNGHTVKSDVPANAKFTDTTYNDATTTSSGLMSASDKTTIENLKNGAVTGIKGNAETKYRTGNVNITAEDIGMNVDSALSSTSANPVQNKVVADALEDKANISIYGDDSVSLGRKSGTAVGTKSFAFGYNTVASGNYSHAEGDSTKASGDYSQAFGYNTVASGDYSQAFGYNTVASVSKSHAEGYNTEASGSCSHAEGNNTTASGNYSHAEGYNTEASNYASHVSGKYNAKMTIGGTGNNKNGHAFVIGNGTSSALSNAFSVMYSGVVKAASTITASTTADYAEFFEWEDGNPDAEDRVGKFVTLNGDKISIATSNEDYILGIVSGEPFVLGNGDCDTWNGMYLRDEFGRTILEPAPKIEIDEETGEEKEFFDEDGNIIYEGTRPVLNPDYDPTQPYISRFDRPEWSPVGMLGVLSVIQDGTCKVNGYCCCNSEGIATSCDRNTEGACRIIEVINDKVARVIFR